MLQLNVVDDVRVQFGNLGFGYFDMVVCQLPMLHVLVDDDLLLEKVTMLPAERLELFAWTDQLDERLRSGFGSSPISAWTLPPPL